MIPYNSKELLRDYSLPIPWMRIFGSIFAFIILVTLLFVEFPDVNFKLIVFLLGFIFGGWYFVIEAFEAVFQKKKINIDVLMTLAILGAGLLSQYIEGMTIVFLYSITETLESYTMKRTRTTIKSLVKLVPRTSKIIVNAVEVEIDVENLKIDDIVQLRPGDYCPTDGIIVKGTAFINEASITGESVPINKSVGNPVFAGSICQDGFIQFKVTKVVSESTVAKIISIVEEAQKNKLPVQQLVDRFTKIYNPLVVLSAFLIFLIPSLLFGYNEQWAILGTTFLVAAAPCALAIATPVTIFAGVGTAGKKGILVKGGAYLEKLGECQGIAFDKTGTLTFGEPIITDIFVLDTNYSKNNVLQLAATLEYASNHPLAKAVLQEAKNNNCELLNGQNLKTIPGKGITGIIDKKSWFFGQLDKDNISDKAFSIINRLQEEGRSISILSSELEIVAIFAFEDQIRPETRQIITDFQRNNIACFMLTGDHQKSASRVAKDLGLKNDQVFAELTPDKKAQIITDLKKQMTLAMVGDGINDAPALAMADLGIAMGTVGTDVALETADVIIMSDSLAGLRDGIAIGKKMRRIIIQNLILSSLIIGVVLFGVLLGVVNLSLAIIAHEGSEVLIVGNSLRLLAKTKINT